MPQQDDDVQATPLADILQESFFGKLLQHYRGRAGLTQEELAERAGVAPRTISDLERGVNRRPRVDTLQRLLDALNLAPDDRARLEAAGRRRTWHHLKDTLPAPGSGIDAPVPSMPSPPYAPPGDTAASRREDWGEAPDVSVFFGRSQELLTLERWIVDEECRLVAIVGLAGVGKTDLSLMLGKGDMGATNLSPSTRRVREHFDGIIWRRLLNAPKLTTVLEELISFVSAQQESNLPDNLDDQISLLLSHLRRRRCLLILDNVETILQGGDQVGQYRAGYEDYGRLFRQLGEVPHRSCVLLTSREKPQELAQLETRGGAIRSLALGGLDSAEAQKVFAEVDDAFSGSADDWRRLTAFYDGNPLALDLAARHIRDAYHASISAFLNENLQVFADLRELLDWYFERLSDQQKEVMYWFAIAREPVSLVDLRELLVGPEAKYALPSTLQALQRLLPLERSGSAFTLQPVLIEYMSIRLIEHMLAEIDQERFALLNSHALLLALAKDYVRESEIRVLMDPLLERLVSHLGQRGSMQKLLRLRDLLRVNPPAQPGYAAANMLHLLTRMNVDLRRGDFSHLPVWQADLREASLIDVNFAYADLAKSAFTDMFGAVLAVAFSPNPFNAAILAAGTGTGDIRLWRAVDGTPLTTYSGHTDWVWTLAFSPDGRYLASGSSDQTVCVWDIAQGTALHTLRGHTHRIRSVAFAPNGTVLASASEDTRIGIWDVDTGRLIRFMDGHTHPVRAIAFTPDGETLVSGGDDRTVRVWDVRTGQETRPPLYGHTSQIWSLAVSPDGKTIASGSDDQTIRTWDLATGTPLKTLQGHASWICSLAFSPDGTLLASASADKAVRLWEPSSGQPVKILQGHTNWVNALCFDQDGLVLASGSHDQTVRLWDVSSGHRIATLQGYSNGTRAVTFSPDCSLLATADRAVRLWSPEDGRHVATLTGHTTWIRTLAFSPDGTFLASGSDDSTARLWTARTAQPFQVLSGHANRVKSVAFSPDGALVASGSDDHTVRVWDVQTGRSRILTGHTNRIRAVAFSPTTPLLASGSDDGTARLWQAQTGALLFELARHTNRVWSIAFSPDGKLLATGSEDRTVCLWDTATGACLSVCRGHTNPVWALAFRPDGTVLGSSSEDQTVRLWEVATGTCLHVLSGHTHPIWTLAFSPDQVTLASGSHDHTVRLWNSYSGRNLAVLEGHSAPVWSVAFSPDGAMLASGSDDGTCIVWDVQRRAQKHTLRGERPYERMNITGVTGVTEAQKVVLRALGAIQEV